MPPMNFGLGMRRGLLSPLPEEKRKTENKEEKQKEKTEPHSPPSLPPSPPLLLLHQTPKLELWGKPFWGKVWNFLNAWDSASTYSFHALERPREVWSAWRFSSFIGDELKDESEASDGYQAGNVNDEALHVTGWHGSGDKISFCLQDWEMAKVALSCRSRLALDILSQEMYEVERRRGWFGLWARLVLQKGKEVNDMVFWVELAGLFPSKFWYNFRNMVCLRNEGVPSLLLCRLVCVNSLEGWKEEVYLLLKMWWPQSEDWFPDFRCVHEGRESWASHGWSLSVVSQSQTFQHWWGVTLSIRSHVDCVLNHGKIIKIHLIMQFEFQQPKSCFSVKVPPDSVHRQSADLPVVLQRRVPTVHPVHKTAEIPQVLFQVDVLAVVQRQVPAVLSDVGGASGSMTILRRVWLGFFAAFFWNFRTPSIWTSSPGSQLSFRWALEGQQLLVIEGPCQFVRKVVWTNTLHLR